MASFYKDIIQLLKSNGWIFHRSGKGSHEIWFHAEKGMKITVPYDCAKRHTANAIMKQAGIEKKF